MGWLGWTPEKLAPLDVNVIKLALEGRVGLLESIFGKGEAAAPGRKPMTADAFHSFAASHNRRYERGKGRRGD